MFVFGRANFIVYLSYDFRWQAWQAWKRSCLIHDFSFVIYVRCRLLTNLFSSLQAVSSYKRYTKIMYDKNKIERDKALYDDIQPYFIQLSITGVMCIPKKYWGTEGCRSREEILVASALLQDLEAQRMVRTLC